MKFPNAMEKREAVVSYALKFLGQPYEWGGDGRKNKGFDCSGLVQEVLHSIGAGPKTDLTAQGIYNLFKDRSGIPSHQHGNLIFFGKDLQQITHIGITLNEYQYIEAGGGDSKNLAGMVRIRPQWHRKDMLIIIDFIKE